jgi:hypothetical protein
MEMTRAQVVILGRIAQAGAMNVEANADRDAGIVRS